MSSSEPDVGARLREVRGRIEAAARRVGRAPGGVRLVAVSKNVAPAAIVAAADAGQVDFGENRAQELAAHAETVGRPELRWHFVGRLQRNKVKAVAPVVTMWQSVDRPELVAAVARHAPSARVLVQVDLAAERQKGGCAPGDAAALVDLAAAAGLAVEGLMTVPPAGVDPRPHFAALREMAAGLGLSELSMGMTGDFEVAVEEGATIVRVGTALFGPRPGTGPARR